MQESYNLLEIRNLYGYSQTEFAQKVKMSRELVSKIENGKTELKRPTIRKIQKFLENHSITNFSQDVNFMGRPAQASGKSAAHSYQDGRLERKNEPGSYMVPLVGIKAQAGYIKGFEHTDYMDTLEQYSLPPGVNPTGAVWSYFEIDGDSMEPTLHPGDIVLASMLPHEDWKEIRNYYVYIILTGSQLMVKRVFCKSPDEWVLISDNEELYPQTLLPVAEVKQVWTFRRHIRSKVPPPHRFAISA